MLGACNGVADDEHAGSGLGGAGDFLDECRICCVEVLELDGRFLDLGIGDGVMGGGFSDDSGDERIVGRRREWLGGSGFFDHLTAAFRGECGGEDDDGGADFEQPADELIDEGGGVGVVGMDFVDDDDFS